MDNIFNMAYDPINKAASGLRQARNQQPLQMAVTGPTAQSVNSAPTQTPMTRSSFYARGGLTNTGKAIMNSILQRKKEREDLAKYEEYLIAGERGAGELYNNMVKQFGEEIKNWIPPKELFYDESGIFLPHKYAQSVKLGYLKFVESQEKLKGAQLKKEEYQTISGALGGAQTRQEASAKIAALGYDPNAYEGAYKTIPTIGDMSSAALNEEKQNTEKTTQQLKQAQADWFRRRKDGSGGSGTSERDYHFEQAKGAYGKAVIEKNKADATLKTLRTQRLDYEENFGTPEQIAHIDEQIAKVMADLEVANANLKRERATINNLISKQSNEGRKAAWEAAVSVEVDPAVEKIASLIEENLALNQNNPGYNIQEHIDGFIDHYTKNLNMDSMLMDEVKKLLKERYSPRSSGIPQAQPQSGPQAANPQIEQKVREIWAKRGVNNPTPKQMQNGVASILRQMGQQQ